MWGSLRNRKRRKWKLATGWAALGAHAASLAALKRQDSSDESPPIHQAIALTSPQLSPQATTQAPNLPLLSSLLHNDPSWTSPDDMRYRVCTA